jgi:Na+/H+-dicarboxylate symporter
MQFRLKSRQVKSALAVEYKSVCPVIPLSSLSEIVDMIRSHMNFTADLACPTVTAQFDLNLTPEIIHEKGLTVLEGCQLES